MQPNTSLRFRSRDREAVLLLDFPHFSPCTFHLLFPLYTSGFLIPAPRLKWSSEPEPCARSEWKLKPGNLPWVQVSRQAWNLFLREVSISLGVGEGFLDFELLQDAPNKGEKKLTSRRKHSFNRDVWYFLTGKNSLWKTQLLEIIVVAPPPHNVGDFF